MKKLINPVIMVAGAVALGGCVLSTPDAVGTGDVVRTNGLPFASDVVTGGATLSTAVTGRTASFPWHNRQRQQSGQSDHRAGHDRGKDPDNL